MATAVLPTPVGPKSAIIRMNVGSQLVQISGSTVLLTGATGGIGHAIARALRGAGASLVITGRRRTCCSRSHGSSAHDPWTWT